jgi:hypothetical protein
MLSSMQIWALAPTDPYMILIRKSYFNTTGHYGSDDEIKLWYTGFHPAADYSKNKEDDLSA